ncbi:MAG: DUF6046 domain-containing protein [Prevotellaceae bacterium]|jgi:hypothetical protein|nr:DUF6046 domain-containing protein [Prevotellaceae bacterium]
MGQIIINIASGIAKRALHIATLDNMHLVHHPQAGKPALNATLGVPVGFDDMLHNTDDNNDNFLRVRGGSYKDLLSEPRNNIIVKDAGGKFEIEFINAKCKIIKANTIAETAVVNRDGMVKEFINAKDYNITVSGDIVTNKQYSFPVDEMKTLIGLLSQKTNLKVAGALFYMFGIEQMVFKTGTFDQTAAKYVNAMPFTLEFASDINYDFLIEETGG